MVDPRTLKRPGEDMSAFHAAIELRSYRPASEDRAAVIQRDDGLLLVVADGVGGRSGGAEAAQTLVDFVRAEVGTIASLSDPRAFHRLLVRADAAIHAHATAGETTAIVAGVSDPGCVVGASVEDSEAWLVTDSACLRLTPRATRKPYLGYGMAVPFTFHESFSGGTLVLATDGLFKYADESKIVAAVRLPALDAAARAAVEAPLGASRTCYDDIAVILCRAVPSAA